MKQNLGIILIVLGALMLIISYFADLVDYNFYNVVGHLVVRRVTYLDYHHCRHRYTHRPDEALLVFPALPHTFLAEEKP